MRKRDVCKICLIFTSKSELISLSKIFSRVTSMIVKFIFCAWDFWNCFRYFYELLQVTTTFQYFVNLHTIIFLKLLFDGRKKCIKLLFLFMVWTGLVITNHLSERVWLDEVYHLYSWSVESKKRKRAISMLKQAI